MGITLRQKLGPKLDQKFNEIVDKKLGTEIKSILWIKKAKKMTMNYKILTIITEY